MQPCLSLVIFIETSTCEREIGLSPDLLIYSPASHNQKTTPL